jgi:23S rRNA pseudouridine2605 synthase
MVSWRFMEGRLQKILSGIGVTSRRKAEELILKGRVTVNGAVSTLGMKADAERDYIKIDGKLVTHPGTRENRKVYLLFHKPDGVVTTLHDPEGRPTVKDFLRGVRTRVFPVGRLDFHSEGLLLLTNDGDFANNVLHPSRKIPKTYLVKVKGTLEETKIGELRRGVRLEEGMTMPARVKMVKNVEQNSWIEITIHQGRTRQVRRMLEQLGHPVLKLKRIAIGGLTIGDLRPGEFRILTAEEINAFQDYGISH